jgi:hypothetical protein
MYCSIYSASFWEENFKDLLNSHSPLLGSLLVPPHDGSTIFEKSESTLPEDHPCQAWLLYVEQARLKCEEKINEDI